MKPQTFKWRRYWGLRTRMSMTGDFTWSDSSRKWDRILWWFPVFDLRIEMGICAQGVYCIEGLIPRWKPKVWHISARWKDLILIGSVSLERTETLLVVKLLRNRMQSVGRRSVSKRSWATPILKRRTKKSWKKGEGSIEGGIYPRGAVRMSRKEFLTVQWSGPAGHPDLAGLRLLKILWP